MKGLKLNMIAFVRNWAEGIIVSVIVASIIEMILPEGSSKKYIKVVIGIYILFVIVTPVINNFKNQNFNVGTVIDMEENKEYRQVSSSNLEEKNIKNIKLMYETNLKSDIKTKLQNKQYLVGNVALDISDDEKYTINKIEVKIIGKQDEKEEGKKNKKEVITIIDNIEKVKIDLSKKCEKSDENEEFKISEKESEKLKEYLSGIYDVNIKNIQIN